MKKDLTNLIRIFRELGMSDEQIGRQLENIVGKPTRLPRGPIGKKRYSQIQISKRKRRP